MSFVLPTLSPPVERALILTKHSQQTLYITWILRRQNRTSSSFFMVASYLGIGINFKQQMIDECLSSLEDYGLTYRICF